MVSDFNPRPLKKLFTANQYWTFFLDAGDLRDIEVEVVTKMLACGTRITGVKEYGCDNPDFRHVKYITNACHSRAYPSCGKKATDLWIAAQLNRRPDCDWIHLVSPSPIHCGLCLRSTAGALTTSAVWRSIIYCTPPVSWGLDIGIFCALHTYGRRLNCHPHVHVSVTCGGIDEHGKWKKIRFRKDAMRARWMWNIRQMLRCCLASSSKASLYRPPWRTSPPDTVAQPGPDRWR